MAILSFDELSQAVSGRFGVSDIPCPFCSEIHNPRRRVMRVWFEPRLATFHCARCSESGWARDTHSSVPPNQERLSKLQFEAELRDAAYQSRRLALARFLWRSAQPLQSTIGETYLREARGYRGLVPSTLRFLPPTRKHHKPAMLAAFGMASEPEPGLLSIKEDHVMGVHLTLLQRDGCGKAGTDRDKFMIAKSKGWPICLAPPNDLLGLAITEGIENGLSVSEATGLGVWAAGAAGRLPHLAGQVPTWVNCVTIVADADATGIKSAKALAWLLKGAGYNADLCLLDSPRRGVV
jgi:hypothetical protein